MGTVDEKSIQSEFNFASDSKKPHSGTFPTVDFSLLTSSDQDQRSKILHVIEAACREWGFFTLVNHGIPETLLKATIAASSDFFELPAEEKRRYETNSASDPIKSGTGSGGVAAFRTTSHGGHIWGDFLKCYVHPDFNCPPKPQTLRDNLYEYSEKTRPVFKELMHAVGENLGFEEGFIDGALKLDSCYQLYAANYYPPCPESLDLTLGIPAHTDNGFLTFLIDNGAGLQIQRNGQWFDVGPSHNAILVNISDHLEILSNGRYKSVRHRAIVDMEATRISIVMINGAAPDAIVAPAPPLVEKDGRPFYRPMKFIEYAETKLSNALLGKHNLERVKIQEQ